MLPYHYAVLASVLVFGLAGLFVKNRVRMYVRLAISFCLLLLLPVISKLYSFELAIAAVVVLAVIFGMVTPAVGKAKEADNSQSRRVKRGAEFKKMPESTAKQRKESAVEEKLMKRSRVEDLPDYEYIQPEKSYEMSPKKEQFSFAKKAPEEEPYSGSTDVDEEEDMGSALELTPEEILRRLRKLDQNEKKNISYFADSILEGYEDDLKASSADELAGGMGLDMDFIGDSDEHEDIFDKEDDDIFDDDEGMPGYGELPELELETPEETDYLLNPDDLFVESEEFEIKHKIPNSVASSRSRPEAVAVMPVKDEVPEYEYESTNAVMGSAYSESEERERLQKMLFLGMKEMSKMDLLREELNQVVEKMHAQQEAKLHAILQSNKEEYFSTLESVKVMMKQMNASHEERMEKASRSLELHRLAFVEKTEREIQYWENEFRMETDRKIAELINGNEKLSGKDLYVETDKFQRFVDNEYETIKDLFDMQDKKMDDLLMQQIQKTSAQNKPPRR